MKHHLLRVGACATFLMLSLGKVNAAPAAPSYENYAALSARLRELASGHGAIAKLTSIGKSREGRDLWALQVAADGMPLERRPGVLVVGNLSGGDLASSALALRVAEALLARADAGDAAVKALLATRVFYFIPCLNPDGAERMFGTPAILDRRNAAPAGDEGRLADLNGDGVITMMRVPNPDGAWRQDEKDPRLLVPAGRSEAGQYDLLPEGDFKRVEGAARRPGVDLNRNFPINWRMEFEQAGAGPRPVSEPEVRAFLEFADAHPNLFALQVLQVGSDDPALPSVEQAPYDQVHYEALGKKYQELFGGAFRKQATAAPGPAAIPQFAGGGGGGGGFFGGLFGGGASNLNEQRPAGTERYAGTLLDWAYETHGLLACATELWTDPPKPTDPEKKRAEGERGWLEWNDEALGGAGFAAWQPFAHPALGKVDIGGWKPFTKDNPPLEVVTAAVEPSLKFLLWRAEQTPQVALKDVTVEALGGDYYRLRATVTDTGPLATSTGKGVSTRDDRAVFLQVDLTSAEIVVGERRPSAGVLGPGREKTFEWILHRTGGSGRAVVTADSARAGLVTQSVDLR